MRNILEKIRQRDYYRVKADAQAIYLAASRCQAEAAFRRLQAHWAWPYPGMVRRLEQDLPELLTFFRFPRHLWRKLRTTNVIERCFVEVRRRTRPMGFALSMSRVWTGSSMPSSIASTWSGVTAPSVFLHRPPDITDARQGSVLIWLNLGHHPRQP